MKRILVTGANGFIGLSLTRKLMRENFRVRGAVGPGKASPLPKGVEAEPIEYIDGNTDWSFIWRPEREKCKLPH